MLGALFASACFFGFALFYSCLAVLTWPFSPSGRLYQWWIRLWARTVVACARVKLTVEGRETLDTSRAYVIMSNHRSNFDVATLVLALAPMTVLMVAKRSLGFIPIFGWGLKLAHFVFIDRSNRQAALATLAHAKRRIENGKSILIFPEGTRSFDGRLLPFKKGGFVMALETGAAILPMGISGTEKILPKDSALVWSGPVTVRIGQPIDTAPYRERPKEELMDRVRGEIARLAGVELEAAVQK